MFRHISQGGHQSLGITFSMLQGKTNREVKENYGVVVCNKNVECSQIYDRIRTIFHSMIRSGSSYIYCLGYMPSRSLHLELILRLPRRSSTLREWCSRRKPMLHEALALAMPRMLVLILFRSNHGGWGKGRVSTYYRSRISDVVPSKMAGCTLQRERLWLSRNTLLPPVELQRMLFPCFEDYAKEGGHYAIGYSGQKT
ncbi:unnamed protein product [Mortierella alpina]